MVFLAFYLDLVKQLRKIVFFGGGGVSVCLFVLCMPLDWKLMANMETTCFFLKLQFFQSCFLSKLFTTMCADYGNQCVFARTTNSHMPSFNEAGMVSQNLAKIKICLAVKYDWVSYKKKRSFFCNLGALFIKQKFMVKVQMLILV